MSGIHELHERYHKIIDGSFTKQDKFTIDKAIARSHKVLPRGRVYHRHITREVGV